ncbi:metallophosphoesterase [Oceanospirillum linum]|uniref:Calcineurin-like phosphoesterase domain-containing protein n=1 Tax=Oceanospirillum linum TaxID=966 RepID=A0A1T1HFX3_OCELI|nr:metallophosphoesterase [Oceanospirillum linum]OOV88759.1 hypothetical protein BTA35_0204580 [Oceanospirillum linum]SEG00688.1 Icc protein [Oleiphilus messinensis]SMP22074.1 Icc protein [Oceanospirillum linum]
MPVSVIQLTDLHLFARTEQDFKGQNPWQNLQAILQQIERQGLPDLFLLTGDLSQDETSESYRILSERMDAVGVPWVWIPGNHDQPELMAQYRSVESSVCLGRWQWLLLSSNSGQPHGELSVPARNQLLEMLADPMAEFQAVAVHHQPLLVGPDRQGFFHSELAEPGQVAGIDSIPLRDDGWLWQTLCEYRHVKAVICGHVHQAHQIERDGLVLYTTPATSIQFAPHINNFEIDSQAPGYRNLTLLDDGNILSKVERLNLNSAAFPESE